MINYEEAQRFLGLLDGTLIFQTFSEGLYKEKNIINKSDICAKKITAKSILSAGTQNVLNKLSEQGAGIFFQVNEGTGRGAAHITCIRAVFLDLDGEPLDGVLTAVRAGYPKPHAIVVSSPGRYHVYWKVAGCTLDQFSRTQKLLANAFNGDPVVHNLDRVMRLPGTINHKYGDNFRVTIKHLLSTLPPYDVSVFENVPHVPVEDALGKELSRVTKSAASYVDINDAYQVTSAEIDSLPAGDRTQKLISLAGKLVLKHQHASVDDIMGMLYKTSEKLRPEGDPPVSNHAWDVEILPGVTKFVERRNAAIQAETEDVTAAMDASLLSADADSAEVFAAAVRSDIQSLKEFAQRYVYVSTEQVIYDLERSAASPPWTLAAFKEVSKVFKTDGGTPVFNKWSSNVRYRITVHRSMYRPYAHSNNVDVRKHKRIFRDIETGDLCYNTYAPPSIIPAAADREELLEQVRPFLDHINFLCPDAADAQRLIQWCAATVKTPERRVTWAPLLVSRHQGIGKGWLAQMLRQIVGHSNFQLILQDQLTDAVQHNDFMADSTVVVVDEIKARRREDVVNKLNAMITEPVLEVNKKYGKKGLERIYANFICFSNHIDALAISEEDRRFWVLLMEQQPKSEAYYTTLFDWLKGKGPSYLLQYLLEVDLSGFSYGGKPPLSASKLAMVRANHSEIEILLEDAWEQKEGPLALDIVCKDWMVQWACKAMGRALEREEDKQIQNWLRRRGRALRPIKGLGTRQTMYAVRYSAKWLREPEIEILNHARRAKLAATDVTNLKTVK